jgi:putative DNA primase/helicase
MSANPTAAPQPDGSVLDEHASEHQLALILKAEFPPIRCVGEEWFVYNAGAWRKRSRDDFKPRALSVQNKKTRTARMAANVLSHLEFELQADPQQFRSFCCFGGSGEVLLNCANGVLRVTPRRIELLNHSPDYLFTGQLEGRYNAQACAETFERVLQEALPDPDDLELFRLFSGYLLYPDCRFEASLVCYGPGGTGKSTLSGAIENVMGLDLVRHLSLEQICNPQSKLLAQLQRAGLNIATELNTIQTVGGDTLKQLISGETVQADRKYLSDISLKSACKFWFALNYLPRFQHGTDAELRRLRFLNFDNKPATIDPALKQKLALERDGIFVFMLDGLRRLMQRRDIPHGGQKSLQTRERFNIQNDPIGSFITTECDLGPNQEVFKDNLFEAYQNFCKRNGIPPPDNNSFFFRELLSRHAVQNIRRRDGDGRVQKIAGIALRQGS